MYTLNIARATKKMSINEIRYFILENYYKRTGFSKENSYYSTKHLKRKDLLLVANNLTENTPDPRNAKQHYESFLRQKKRASVKQSEIITHEPKIFDIVHIK